MFHRSFRTRLLAWNMAMLLLTLAAVSGAVFLAQRSALHSLVDHDLQARAGQFSAAFSAGRYGLGMGMGQGWRMRQNGDLGSAEDAAELNRLLLFHRPRYFDLQERGLGPMAEMPPWDSKALRQAQGGQELYSNVIFDEESVRVLTKPLHRDGKVVAVLQIARETGDMARLEKRLIGIFLGLALPALLLVTVSSLFLTRQVLQPVQALSEAASEMGAGDLARRLEVRGNDEMTELARTFNGMVARLQEAFASKQQALEQQQRFTSDVSHELRTPLARLKAVTSLALENERSAQSYRQSLQTADAAADAMTKLVTDLLLLARSDAGQLHLEKTELALEDVLRTAVIDLSRPGAPVEIKVAKEFPSLHADRFHLERVFLNLLDNARRHTPPDGRITVTAAVDGDFINVTITDSGEGIAPEHLPHLGERFYRADASRTRHGDETGSGLGLSIAQSIVAAHGGTLAFESTLGSGTTATVKLPQYHVPL